jgi:hypothetical protein
LEDFERKGASIDWASAMKVAIAILKNGPLVRDEYDRICGSYKKGDDFLAKNVFAIDSQGHYGFENKIAEHAVHDKLTKRSRQFFQ